MSSGNLRDAFRSFTTTCALITVNGPRGPNVMAAEWTFNVSYDPFLIAVHIDPANVTHDEILAAGEFGVNLVSDSQGPGIRFAGHFSKAETDKLTSEVFETYPAKRIRAPLIRGSLLTAECRLVNHVRIGDHTAFIGEVIEFTVNPEMSPLILHHGSHRVGTKIERRPGIVLAVTPARARPGGQIRVDGELSSPHGTSLTFTLIAADGTELPLGGIDPATEDSFEATFALPSGLSLGRYRLVGRSEELEGGASFELAK